MDPLSKNFFKEIERMHQQRSRIFRNIAISRMVPLESCVCKPAIDIYESEQEFFVYADIAGVKPDELNVTVEGQQLHISGERQLPFPESVACVHQLEIELGAFERTVHIPDRIFIDQVSSTYKHGILVITLPKMGEQKEVKIAVSSKE